MFLTNKEAIKILQNERNGLCKILDKSVPYERKKTLVALDMAIQALKDEDEMEVPERQRMVDRMKDEEAIYELETNVDYKTPAIKEACQMAIRSLETDKKIVDVLYEIRNKITMLFIFDRESVVGIIDKYLREVEHDSKD